MVKIIETNLSLDACNEIKDHQSRVIEVFDWNSYINEIKECKSINRSSVIGSLYGYSIPKESTVVNLTYDDKHLDCDIINRFGIKTKKLVYLV